MHKAARRSAHTARATQPAAPLSQAPAQPKPPDWPVNNPPHPASIGWNGHELSITADNSSLKQILNDVSAHTGAKVEGLNFDERIFGSYGPGQVREVLSQLLDGSGYNVMIIGNQGRATPLQIVLSGAPKGSASPSPNNPSGGNENSSAAQPPQPYAPPPPMIGNGFRPGMPPRTSQELMEEIRQRRLEIEQQRQMREQGVQPN